MDCDVRFDNYTSGTVLFPMEYLEALVPRTQTVASQTGAIVGTSVATHTAQTLKANVLEYGDAWLAKSTAQVCGIRNQC